MTNPIMKGAEPFSFPGSNVGVLVVHGYTGSPQSMRHLGEGLHKAGLTVHCPLLKGHGTSPEDMAKTSATDWVRSAEEGLEQLRSKAQTVFVAGLSMGGLLSLYLAATNPDVVRGVISINSPVHVESLDIGGLAFGRDLPPLVPGIGSDIKDPNSKELAYELLPVATVKHILALSATVRVLLPNIKCPTLVIQSREDHLVPAANAGIIASNVGSKQIEILWLDNSYHVATIDNDKDLIVQESIRFVQRHAAA